MSAFKTERPEFPLSLTLAPGRDQLLDWRLPLYPYLEVTPGPLKVFVRKWLPQLPDSITEQLKSQKGMVLSPSEAEADLVVQVRPEGYDITGSFDPLRPLVARIEDLEGYNPSLVLDFLTHIHRWQWLRAFTSASEAESSPASSMTGSSTTTYEPLEVFATNANGGPPVQQYWENQHLRLAFDPVGRQGDRWDVQIALRLSNAMPEPLYFSVLQLTQNFGIVAGPGANDQIRLLPQEKEDWPPERKPLQLTLEDQTIRYMLPESTRFLLVLATPAPFDHELYLQEALPVPGQQQPPRKASYFVRTRRQLKLPPRFALARLYTLTLTNPFFEEPNLFDLAGQLVRAFSGHTTENAPQMAGEIFHKALKIMWGKAEEGKMTETLRRLDRLQSDLEKVLASLSSGSPQAASAFLLETLQVMEEINLHSDQQR